MVFVSGYGSFSSTWRGTFSLYYVAAHVLQHGAGNAWAKLRARRRAGRTVIYKKEFCARVLPFFVSLFSRWPDPSWGPDLNKN